MAKLRVVSYNLDHYDPLGYSEGKYQYDDTGIADRFELIPEAIKGIKPDIVLAQEVYGTSMEQVEASFDVLASRLGMCHTVGGARTVAKSVRQNLGNGVLWNDRFRPTSWRAKEHFWKPLSVVEGLFENIPAAFASYHAQSVGKVEEYSDLRKAEAYKLADYFYLCPLLILGGDHNNLGAVRGTDGAYLDPEPQPLVPLDSTMTEREKAFVLDRSPAAVLERGSIIDIAAHLALKNGEIPECTTGSRPTREGPQRLDRFYALPEIAAMATEVHVMKNQLTELVSDHYPIVLDMDLERS